MKKSKKKPLIIVAIVLIALVVIGITNQPPASSDEDSQIPTQSVSPDMVTQTPDEEPPEETPTDDVQPSTQPPVEDQEMTPYLQLAKDENAYLLFLRIIGTCYKDNTLTEEMFNEMAENSDVQTLVQDVLNYRYQNGTLSPDFVSSFSAFWDDSVSSAHQEVTDALKISFDLEYDFVKKAWILKENNATVAAHTENDTTDSENFEWLPAIGHLYGGVDLYIVTEDTVTHYGTITALTSEEVEIYLIAAEKAQWFGRRIPLITDVLKVRSDDPHLPQY